MISGEPRPPVIVISDPKDRFNSGEKKARRGIFEWVVLFGLLMGVLSWLVLRPGTGLTKNVVVTYEEGTPLGLFLAYLKEQGIIRSVLATRVFVHVYGSQEHVPAGEYFFAEGSWAPSIAKQLAKGDHRIPVMKITIPEGLTNKEIAEIFKSKLPAFDTEKFLTSAAEKEGSLFPNTYDVFATAKPEDIVDMLHEEYITQVATLQEDLRRSGKSEQDMVTMASILEGEVRTEEDRRLVSGILWKRIEKGMYLQVDATFSYLIGKGSAELTMTDLSLDSPYNTYRHKGLPPGPINNPGLDAMRAAINPEASPYYFYLSDKDGNTHYAKTFDEHKDNKAKYLK